MINLYQGATNAQRKAIDRDLKRRARPRMFYQTSVIHPSPAPGVPPFVYPINSKPYTRA